MSTKRSNAIPGARARSTRDTMLCETLAFPASCVWEMPA